MIEAMKQALEAFEALQSHGDIAILVTPEREFNFARISKELRQAIAEAEKQEPVAWRETHGKVIKALASIVNVHTPDKLFDLDAIPRDPVMVLVQDIKAALDKYKPPQPKRQWVGLTDEEIDDLAEFHGLDFMSYAPFTRAIEDKLKEKNT